MLRGEARGGLSLTGASLVMHLEPGARNIHGNLATRLREPAPGNTFEDLCDISAELSPHLGEGADNLSAPVHVALWCSTAQKRCLSAGNGGLVDVTSFCKTFSWPTFEALAGSPS